MTKKQEKWDPSVDVAYQSQLAEVIAQDRERADRRDAARLAAQSYAALLRLAESTQNQRLAELVIPLAQAALAECQELVELEEKEIAASYARFGKMIADAREGN